MKELFPKPIYWGFAFIVIIVLSMVALQKSYEIRGLIDSQQPSRSISVSAEASVRAVPDLAIVELGVYVTGQTAGSVQEESTKKINDLTNYILSLNVDKKNISTTQASINPLQDFSTGNQKITGYQSNQSVSVRLENIDESTDILNQIIGQAVSNGANQINGVRFDFLDPNKAKSDARIKAIENAKDQARQLSEVSGLKLGRIINIHESAGSDGYPVPYAITDSREIASSQNSAPQIQPGDKEIKVMVDVEFAIK